MATGSPEDERRREKRRERLVEDTFSEIEWIERDDSHSGSIRDVRKSSGKGI